MKTISEFSIKGIITDEFGEKVATFVYRPSMMAYTINWHKARLNGYTLEGVLAWADRLGYYAE